MSRHSGTLNTPIRKRNTFLRTCDTVAHLHPVRASAGPCVQAGQSSTRLVCDDFSSGGLVCDSISSGGYASPASSAPRVRPPPPLPSRVSFRLACWIELMAHHFPTDCQPFACLAISPNKSLAGCLAKRRTVRDDAEGMRVGADGRGSGLPNDGAGWNALPLSLPLPRFPLSLALALAPSLFASLFAVSLPCLASVTQTFFALCAFFAILLRSCDR